MIQDKNWYKVVMKASNICNQIINFICVSLMTAQTLSIIIMVIGRYFFNKVPQWTEQFALFCMIWFAMFSIALAVRTDSHVKMEVVDNFVGPLGLLCFKLFGNLCTAAFGAVLVIYGMEITRLTMPTMLSAFRIPLGIQYFSAVAGGFFMIVNAAVYCIEITAKYIDEKKSKEEV